MHHHGPVVDHSIICQNKQVVFGQLSRCSFPQHPLVSRLPVNEWSRLEARSSPSGKQKLPPSAEMRQDSEHVVEGASFPMTVQKAPFAALTVMHYRWLQAVF